MKFIDTFRCCLMNFLDLLFLSHHPIGVLRLVLAFFMFKLFHLLFFCFQFLK